MSIRLMCDIHKGDISAVTEPVDVCFSDMQLCTTCQPVAEYVRLFDVTERTALRRHKTGRTCHKCKGPLKDSIIHFGEKSPPHSPYNWRQAAKCADDADLIVCLGTSLKVSVQTTLT